jgi:hypothetical protein
VVAVSGALTVGLSTEHALFDGAAVLRLVAEGGFLVHSGFAFDGVTRDVEGGTDPARLPAAPVDAGRLDLTGPTWRVGVALAL